MTEYHEAEESKLSGLQNDGIDSKLHGLQRFKKSTVSTEAALAANLIAVLIFVFMVVLFPSLPEYCLVIPVLVIICSLVIVRKNLCRRD